MARHYSRKYNEIRQSLAHLDVHYHSLRLLGQKLLSESSTSVGASSGALYARTLQLGKECSLILQLLNRQLDPEDVDLCASTLNGVDLALNKASQMPGATLYTVNVWRVITAVGEFLAVISGKYGYQTLSESATLEQAGVREARVGKAASSVQAEGRLVAPKLPAIKPLALPTFRGVPRWRVRRLLNPGLVLGALIVMAFVLVALGAPVIAPPEGEDPYWIPQDGYSIQPRPPRPGHPLGTIERSYDVFYGLVWGTRVAFRIGLSVTLGRALIGVLLGLIGGYYGGLFDALVMRITDAFMAFPIVPATLLMLTFFGPTRWATRASTTAVNSIIVLSLILFGWMQYARLVRGNVLAERAKQYVEAAVAVGARGPRIIFRHVLPNVPQGLFVMIASDVGAMVVLAAVFTFLGLAGRPGLADWGSMLNISRNWIIGTPSSAFEYWYTYLPPIATIVLFSVGWNLVGDGLRDVFDPRLR
ncbi:MAG: ABC transporter permease subunit [Anaerolineae bacterium]|nr:ABC transporter permease subunit [Anaerolineae bacterium]NIN99440.1 ABC transporter permease subunit [Anaerolineae bacterium]NIQ82305.1 ABC transporter permease subunit [Anaerolineae bacterium]